MSDSMQAKPATDRSEGHGQVTSLWTDVVLDAQAVLAQRMALLVEMTAHQYDVSDLDPSNSRTAPHVQAAWHLEQAAKHARTVADQERARCASRANTKAPVSGTPRTLAAHARQARQDHSRHAGPTMAPGVELA